MYVTTTSPNPYVKLAMEGYPATKQFAPLIMIKLAITMAGTSQKGGFWIRVSRQTAYKTAEGNVSILENAFLTTETLVDAAKAKHIELPEAFVNKLTWS